MTWMGIGEFTLGACVPMANTAYAAIGAAVGVSLPAVQARIAGLVKVQARVAVTPPSVATDLAAAVQLVARLQAAVAMPAFDVTLLGTMIADVQAILTDLSVRATFAANFGILLGTPGIYLARHSGAIGDVFPGGLPGGADPYQPIEGIAVFATDAGAWAAIQAVFKTS